MKIEILQLILVCIIWCLYGMFIVWAWNRGSETWGKSK